MTIIWDPFGDLYFDLYSDDDDGPIDPMDEVGLEGLPLWADLLRDEIMNLPEVKL